MRYYGESGELIKATFLDIAGHSEAELNRSSGIARVFSIITGIFLAWGICMRYQRDPEGEIEDTREPSNLSDAVDQQSLLHLSNDPRR